VHLYILLSHLMNIAIDRSHLICNISNASEERNANAITSAQTFFPFFSLRECVLYCLLWIIYLSAPVECWCGVTNTHFFSHTGRQAAVRAHGMNRETQGAPFIAHYSRCSNIKSHSSIFVGFRRKESGPCKHDSDPPSHLTS
jgi:hypothetical protein